MSEIHLESIPTCLNNLNKLKALFKLFYLFVYSCRILRDNNIVAEVPDFSDFSQLEIL